MIDQDLERRTADCEELRESWRHFMDLANRAMKPPRNVTSQLEQQFLNNKARIAMLHDSFMDSLKHDRKTGQNMIEIVNRAITLKLLGKLSEAERKKLEIEWHECFLLINETITALNEERERLAEINEFAYNMKKAQEKTILYIKWILRSFYFKFFVFVLLVVGAIWGLIAFGIDDKIRDINQIEPVTKSYLGFMRGIGFTMPYFDIAEFRDALPTRDADIQNVAAVERNPTDRGKEESTSLLVNNMGLRDTNAADILNNADDFDLYNYRTSRDRESAFLFIYYFKHKDDGAQEFDILATASQIPSEYNVYRKANVLLILQSSSTSLTENIEQDVVGKVAPN